MFGSVIAFYLLFAYGMISILLPAKYQTLALLISSGSIQLWALPLLAVQSNKADKKREAKADADHAALTHVAHAVDEILRRGQDSSSQQATTQGYGSGG